MADSLLGGLGSARWSSIRWIPTGTFAVFGAIMLTLVSVHFPDSEAASVTQSALASMEPTAGGLQEIGEVVPGRSEAAGATTRLAKSDLTHVETIASFISRRYLIAPEASRELVTAAFHAGRNTGLDPMLIVAVMAIESRFNPIAESVAGAKGLMQIIPRYHLDKLSAAGGPDSVLEPQINILVGAQILREYLGRTGNMVSALQMYNGALWDETRAYSNKVMSEHERLRTWVKTQRT